MTHELKRLGLIQQEELPGEAVQTDEQLADYVRDNAWGHHASCSCAIGPREANGVLDSRLRVNGIERLRVVELGIPAHSGLLHRGRDIHGGGEGGGHHFGGCRGD